MLKLTDNSKTKFRLRHYNCMGLNFGLPEDGGTCPNATTGPGGCCDMRGGKRQVCYVAKLVALRKNVRDALQYNTDQLVGKTLIEMTKVLEETITQFRKCSKGKDLYFRLHWSGDFFNETYAKAWSTIIKSNPDIKFWAYTRSFDCVEHLAGLANLTLFLSCDPVNYREALQVFEKFKEYTNIGLAWLGTETPKDRRWVTCPETSGKLKNGNQGACSRCRLCIDRFDPVKSRVKNISFCLH